MDRRRRGRHPGHQSGDERASRLGPEQRPQRDEARRRGGLAGLPGVAGEDRGGTGHHPAAPARPHPRASGRPRPASDPRAGQAPRRGEGRGRHERRLCAVVRRGGAAHLRRRHPVALGRPAHSRHQGSGRGRRRDHPMELPVLDDRPQARAGARRRLHDGDQAGVADALFGACLGRAVRGGWRPEGRRQHRHRLVARDRRRADLAIRTSRRSPSPARPRSARS